MSISTLTLVHVIISLVALASGLVATWDLLRGKPTSGWNSLFLTTTVATSVTGFFFFSKFGPPHVIGVLSLVILAVAIYALVSRQLAGRWRTAYIVCALVAFYLNVFVGVVQAFQKISTLHALAPTQSEPPFAVAQGVVLLAFVLAGWLALKSPRDNRFKIVS
jgi:magnesium-transporting ATPase (P-type)